MEQVQKNNGEIGTNEFQTLVSALVSRMNLATQIGRQSYNGARDIYQALGYPNVINYADYEARYFRQDIAKAIIDRPVKATWQGVLELVEPETKEETEFETVWKDINLQFGLQSLFSRADRLTGIGRYGIILMGLDDVKQTIDFRKEVKGKRTLIYLMAFGEGSAQINTYETDTNNPRYGKPVTYSIAVQQLEGGVSETIEVHYSRIIHLVQDPLESDVESTPVLQVVFNRLMDLEKLVGGDAEMFWRGARPGYSGVVDKDYQVTPTMKADFKTQIDEFEHNLRRILIADGVDLKQLEQQIADPANHVDIQIQMISAVTGIPKRILTGTERGELSSAQDSSEWKTYVRIRREDHAEPRVIRPTVKRFLELGILPAPKTGKYAIAWQDLFTLSEADRAKIGRDRAAALKDYTSSASAEAVMAPEDFLEFGMGLTADQVNIIKMNLHSPMAEELASLNQPATPAQDTTAQTGDKSNTTTAKPKLKRTGK
jgi:hypothetical protein